MRSEHLNSIGKPALPTGKNSKNTTPSSPALARSSPPDSINTAGSPGPSLRRGYWNAGRIQFALARVDEVKSAARRNALKISGAERARMGEACYYRFWRAEMRRRQAAMVDRLKIRSLQ